MALEAPQKSQEGAQGSLRENDTVLTHDSGILYPNEGKLRIG